MGRAKELMYDDSELANLPEEAWQKPVIDWQPFDPDNYWLTNASKADQRIALREWFLARYEDPAQHMPYNSREGGYQFIWGGPYHPHEVLEDRFGSRVDDELISEVADELVLDHGDDWAPVRETIPPEYEYYALLDDLPGGLPGNALSRFSERVGDYLSTLELEGSERAKRTVIHTAYSSIIGAVEAYLWETAVFCLDFCEGVRRNFVEKHHDLSKIALNLGDIYKQMEGLNNRVKQMLNRHVWHHWGPSAALYKNGLEVTLPDRKALDASLKTRHDIVHRCGFTVEGQPVEISVEAVQQLAAVARDFVEEADRLVVARWLAPPTPEEVAAVESL